eukprot:144011-Pelagomonas_calceolata.AAC.1
MGSKAGLRGRAEGIDKGWVRAVHDFEEKWKLVCRPIMWSDKLVGFQLPVQPKKSALQPNSSIGHGFCTSNRILQSATNSQIAGKKVASANATNGFCVDNRG